MSVSTEVQRTLVKSPPELWSELSNPDALARHLAELGEVRITSVEPETKVEWEAEGASGIVQLKQSGWGTKVTLSVTRIPPELEAKAELESIAKSRPDPEPTPEAELEPEAAPAVEEAPSGSEAIAEPEPTGETGPVAALAEQETVTEPDTRPGFFARLFGRGHARRRALAEALAEFDAVTEPKLEIVALAAPEPVYPEPAIEPEPQAAAEPTSDLAAELASVEAQMAQETTELLTGVLDRLGAAHHRPFSRG
jgi:hypothetical protein